MAQHDVSMEQIKQTLQGAPQLRSFLLGNLASTGKQLGSGSYGEVVELQMAGLVCAGKKIYDALIDPQNQGAQVMVDKYYKECSLLSELRHPHIVQFLGITFLSDSQLPVLVMERLQGNLDDLLENTPNIPLYTKLSILRDVSLGLVFLHSRNPAVIHRDLTARNILLNAAMTAKIADLGNSRICKVHLGKIAQTMTKGIPGTLMYMPPEASSDHYGPSLDIFSFGHLSLFAAIQIFPCDLLPSTYNDKKKVKARTELERRQTYITILEEKLGRKNDLTVMIKGCLAFAPEKRPTADSVLGRLEKMIVAHKHPHQDLSRLELVKLLEEMSLLKENNKELKFQHLQLEREVSQLKEVCAKNKALFDVKQKEIEILNCELNHKTSQLNKQEPYLLKVSSLQSKLESAERKMHTLMAENKSKAEMLLLKDEHIHLLKSGDQRFLEQFIAKSQRVSRIPRDHITMLRELGKGQFGEVWEGEWNNSAVAVRILDEDVGLRELSILSKLQHPKLTEIYGYCKENGQTYVIMELMRGGNLLNFLRDKGKTLTLPQKINISAQIVTGMTYLETQNFCHSFLTAKNILMGENLTCKVAGYELCIDDDATHYIEIGRHTQWTSPEALTYNKFSIKSDVWSFGVVLYEIFSNGGNPYPGLRNNEILKKIDSGYRLPCPPDCPKQFHDVMMDCWKEHPDDRPSFTSLQMQLDGFFIPDKKVKYEKENYEIPRDQITLTRKLGAGRFGEVWEGQWNMSTAVAVKLLKSGRASQEEFVVEVSLMKKLKHPKLIHLHGVCTNEAPLLIIMEFMKHGSLLDYLRGDGRFLKLPKLGSIMIQIAAGMSYMEEQNCIHRDLSARNILVDENLICKIADFGLARKLEEEIYVAREDMKVPYKWTAPEAVLYFRFSIKSDVWSFGIVLYEILTYGKLPYPGMKNAEVLEKVRDGYRMECPPNCPTEIYDIMMNCWKEDPSVRPTFKALEWQLEELFIYDDIVSIP